VVAEPLDDPVDESQRLVLPLDLIDAPQNVLNRLHHPSSPATRYPAPVPPAGGSYPKTRTTPPGGGVVRRGPSRGSALVAGDLLDDLGLQTCVSAVPGDVFPALSARKHERLGLSGRPDSVGSVTEKSPERCAPFRVRSRRRTRFTKGGRPLRAPT